MAERSRASGTLAAFYGGYTCLPNTCLTRARDQVLHALDDLAGASSLEELRFGDAVWTKSVFASLAPLRSLTRLRRLDFDARRIEDGRVQLLVLLPLLESLDFPVRMFTTEQCAWLRAHLPDSVRGRALVPVESLNKPIGSKDTFIIGKRKPFLNSMTDGLGSHVIPTPSGP